MFLFEDLATGVTGAGMEVVVTKSDGRCWRRRGKRTGGGGDGGSGGGGLGGAGDGGKRTGRRWRRR